MCDITSDNFNLKFSQIVQSLEEAKFISIDLEFSALYPLRAYAPSLFDTPSERYRKLRKNITEVIPIQIGLTAFSFNSNANKYKGTCYNFNIAPASFPTIDRSFSFQSDTLNFLKLHDFDFNKFAYLGVPFINRKQESELRKRIKNNEITKVTFLSHEFENIIEKVVDSINKWYINAKEGEHFIISNIYKKFKTNHEILYNLHKNLRKRFENLWTCIENEEIVVKKIEKNEYDRLNHSESLDEKLLEDLLGFTRIFRLLTGLKKPLIGHNLFQDILLMIDSFESPLPHSYSEFKKLTYNLFPVIYDTKTISYELKNLIPEEKRWADTGLPVLLEYFKNGSGRHLALNSPAIEVDGDISYGKYHEAGWDSFCAGYIFIRMAYFNVYQMYPKSKSFVSSELIGGMSSLKNKVNVIRSSVSFIKIDGKDPNSTRPPFLVVESVKNRPVDLIQVSTALSSFGFVEIRRFPFYKKRALIAVDNFGNARRILSNFKTHDEFRIKQYSALKHSPYVRALLLSSLTLSSAILVWLSHSVLKK